MVLVSDLNRDGEADFLFLLLSGRGIPLFLSRGTEGLFQRSTQR